MKKKDMQVIKDSPITELTKKLVEIEQSLARLTRERYTKQSKNSREGKVLRQTIARIKTVIREKELSV